MMLALPLLFQVALSGGLSVNGGITFDVENQTVEVTNCSVEAQAVWDEFSWQVNPFDVTAANTQSGAGCSTDSAQYPSVSLP